MARRRGIVWFRQDLRLHDNEALTEALRHTDEVLPVYVFDDRVFLGKTRQYGFRKTGPYRARFIIESIGDLRQALRDRQADLIVRQGKPEEALFELARKIRANWVFCNRERTRDEIEVQDTLERQLWTIGCEMRYSRGKMLYYTADLPFPVTHTPDVFTLFRKEVERFVAVREPLPVPERISMVREIITPGDIPSLEELGHAAFTPDERCALDWVGGESAGLTRLRAYLWETDAIRSFRETRNGLQGADFSSKLSPWLAQGCLSPKQLYAELKRYEAERGANEGSYALFFELLWRDFLRFMAKKHGDKIFRRGGVKGEADPAWTDDWRRFERWIDGCTGMPLVDAGMRELAQTGYLSNRGRQSVASYLVHDLHINWQMGAEYFESVLIDYDVTSNWGNWNYVAGVGSDPRDNRYLNVLTQAQRYDPQGDYVRTWLPELSDLPADKIHQPDLLSYAESATHDKKPGKG